MRRGILTGLFALLFVLIYRGTWVWLYQRWTAPDTYYSHGFLIAPVSLYLIWRKRALLVPAVSGGAGAGYFLIAGGLLIHLMSRWAGVGFVSGLTLVPVLLGFVHVFYGSRALRELFFPIAFLMAMVPLPLELIARLSFSLKMLSTAWALVWLGAAGIGAVQEGSFIRMSEASILVGDVCSGLRSLIALLALGALVAYFLKVSWWRRAVVFLSAAPVALLVNTARIAFLCWVAEVYGESAAGGIVHDVSGVLIFASAFVLLSMVREGVAG
ncbi:MAG: exosortase [Candidatus Omnitrophica bacterium]|nr:exosortase [Candidatus Omnitrophota bacterium]